MLQPGEFRKRRQLSNTLLQRADFQPITHLRAEGVARSLSSPAFYEDFQRLSLFRASLNGRTVPIVRNSSR
jgi:hypothetical protein